MGYRIDVGGVSDVAAQVSAETDEMAGPVRRSLDAVDVALAAVASEGGCSRL